MIFTDWNRSGQPALRVSNDREYYKGGQEQMWHLEPGAAPRLYTETDDGWKRLRIWGMGIAAADVNLDGYQDYYLTSMADQKLQFLKDPASGKPDFADLAFKTGVTAHRPYTGGDPALDRLAPAVCRCEQRRPAGPFRCQGQRRQDAGLCGA
jgi:enediyne biosynthesis protein E4